MLKHPKYLVLIALTILFLAFSLLYIYPYKIATLLPFLMIAVAMSVSSIAVLIAHQYNRFKLLVNIASIVSIIVAAFPLMGIKNTIENKGGIAISLLLVVCIGMFILIDQNKNSIIKMVGKLALISYFLLFTLNQMVVVPFNTKVLAVLLLALSTGTILIPFFQKQQS